MNNVVKPTSGLMILVPRQNIALVEDISILWNVWMSWSFEASSYRWSRSSRRHPPHVIDLCANFANQILEKVSQPLRCSIEPVVSRH
jgi:hypothetical protein